MGFAPPHAYETEVLRVYGAAKAEARVVGEGDGLRRRPEALHREHLVGGVG